MTTKSWYSTYRKDWSTERTDLNRSTS
jgi:hypothetical protein